ncbi:MAG: glycosyltransferase [Planctomycetes bacterium]|nr:glycosyltransferase [Planctomycetota bacterium]
MNLVRIQGDPFGDDGPARALRAFLRVCLGGSFRCALSLTTVRPRPAPPDGREVALTDGVRDLRVGTRLPAGEIDLLLRAADQAVAATAPVVVFAPAGALADAVKMAGLEWPRACKVIGARIDQSAPELFERLRGELRWAGTEDPQSGCDEDELRPWLALPVAGAGGPIVHVTHGAFVDGTDLVLTVFAQRLAAAGHRLRLVLVDAPADIERLLMATARAAAPPEVDVEAAIEIIRAPLEPMVVRDAALIVQPLRANESPGELVRLLASGRPTVVSRFQATAALLGRPENCLPLGGRLLPAENELPARFEPDPRALAAAIAAVFGDPGAAAGLARRARRHVVEELTNDRPAAPPVRPADPRRARATVVLEAPFFETSSSAELSLATAQALVARDVVDVHLVASGPFRHDLAALRARAPELVDKLARDPRGADLWLASGWPPRPTRPACGLFALRIDQEYGALPVALTPVVSQEADQIVVHSLHVRRTIGAAGRSLDAITLIPHGVDAVMHEDASPLREVVEFKGDRPAVLFCGGLIWRKGIDVFLRAVLHATSTGLPFAVVVKSVGQEQHYGGFHMRELVDRFARTAGAPPLLCIDRDLSRAEMAGLYTACDVLLHPYRGEGFGLPVLEARACGLPVLATDGGATDDFMSGPGASKIAAHPRFLELPGVHLSRPWVLEPEAEAVGQALVECLRERTQRRAAARSFAAAVRLAFDWQSAAEAIERLANQGMAARRVPLPRAKVAPAVAAAPNVVVPAVPAGLPTPVGR